MIIALWVGKFQRGISEFLKMFGMNFGYLRCAFVEIEENLISGTCLER